MRTVMLATSLLLLAVTHAHGMPHAPGAATAGLTAEEVARLNAGNVVVKADTSTAEGGNRAAGIAAYCVINKPLDAVWAVMLDYQKFDEFMPQLTKVEILERTRDTVKATETVSVALRTVTYTLDVKFDHARRRVSWALDKSRKNDIADTSGAWEFVPYGRGATLVRYTTSVDSGMLVPRFLEELLVKNGVPDVLVSLRRRTESNGAWKKEHGVTVEDIDDATGSARPGP